MEEQEKKEKDHFSPAREKQKMGNKETVARSSENKIKLCLLDKISAFVFINPSQ